MPRIKQDPLIAALIAKLPKAGPGVEWPIAGRKAWLHLMEMAFDTVYGSSGEDYSWVKLAPVNSAVPVKPKPSDHRFFIDAKGFAKNAAGKRILPKDVSGPIFDERGEMGEMRDITWADDSKGLNGADLVITA